LIVVFDTSSLVGAALRPHSVPETALLTAIDRGALVVSRDVVAEYRTVLSRSKFARAHCHRGHGLARSAGRGEHPSLHPVPACRLTPAVAA